MDWRHVVWELGLSGFRFEFITVRIRISYQPNFRSKIVNIKHIYYTPSRQTDINHSFSADPMNRNCLFYALMHWVISTNTFCSSLLPGPRTDPCLSGAWRLVTDTGRRRPETETEAVRRWGPPPALHQQRRHSHPSFLLPSPATRTIPLHFRLLLHQYCPSGELPLQMQISISFLSAIQR